MGKEIKCKVTNQPEEEGFTNVEIQEEENKQVTQEDLVDGIKRCGDTMLLLAKEIGMLKKRVEQLESSKD